MKYLILILSIALTALSSCSKDSELERTTNPIVGDWNYDAIEYDITVNEQDLYKYLDSLNISPENIVLFSLLIESEVKSELEGFSIQFQVDNSYELLKDAELESSGTYDLNIEEDSLILLDSNLDSIPLQILTLNETSLTLAGTENLEPPAEIDLFDADLNITFTVYLIK
jgi:hypothetical protein